MAEKSRSPWVAVSRLIMEIEKRQDDKMQEGFKKQDAKIEAIEKRVQSIQGEQTEIKTRLDTQKLVLEDTKKTVEQINEGLLLFRLIGRFFKWLGAK